MDILAIHGLQKRFGDRQVLCGLDLSIPSQSVFGFVGKNGAGKTTTMKAILGLLRTDGGKIEVLGEPVRFGETTTNRHVGYLPDVPAFYPFLTAREYLALCGELACMDRNAIRTRSDELLTLVGLGKETARIGGFSRGMKQRLGIAQALLGRPKLLICDEPTSALDPIGRREILDILLAVREQTTVLFSTHILSDIERICTDVAILEGGRIALRGTVEELRRAHSTHELTLTLRENADAEHLLAHFQTLTRCADGSLRFSGDEAARAALLSHIATHGIDFLSIEHAEPSLEALFMEVIGQ